MYNTQNEVIQMELLQLRYFYESARTESFNKTAEKFNVPLTSVSASIKRLEKELGCTLFDRQSNRVVLNANGKHFQQSLCQVFFYLDAAVENLRFKDNREIKIFVRSTRRLVSDKIITYNQKYPDVAFKTTFNFNEKDFNDYDIIIDEQKDDYFEYEKFQLFSMPVKLICSKKHPLANKKLSISELAGEKFISIGEGSNMHDILLSACKRAGFSPDIKVVCNDIECYEKFIAAGVGIAIGTERNHPDIAYLDVEDFNTHYNVYAYYKKEAYFGNVKGFVDFLKEK